MYKLTEDYIETLEAILNSGNIAECKIEKGCTPVIVEIKRTKKYPLTNK